MTRGAAARVTSRILAALLIGVLVSQWLLLRVAVTNPPWSAASFMSLVFVILTIVSEVGLLRVREWGFYSAYLLVPFSALFHGVALVPFVTGALPVLQSRIWAVAVLNLLFFLAVAGTHWAVRTGGGEPSVEGSKPIP